MKSIFEETTYEEVRHRIGKLKEDSERQWGRMSPAQMLAHCQNPLALGLGKIKMPRPNFAMWVVYQGFKAAMYNDRLWKPNMKTARQYEVNDPRDFEKEKKALLQLIEEFHQRKNSTHWDPHPGFGSFTHEQWGKMQYKHLDHHLRQFGV